MNELNNDPTNTTESTTPVAIVLDDERMDLPSASHWKSFIIECPGAYPLLQSVRSELIGKPEESSPEALRGQRIHKARETGSTAGLLDDTEIAAYNTGCKLEVESVHKWKDEFGIREFQEQPLELRLWLNDPTTFAAIASARLDAHYLGKTNHHRILLLHDWKSGSASYRWCPAAKDNWQMKVGAVLAADEYDADFVRVELNRMEHQNPHVDRHDYNRDELNKIKEQMLEQLASIGPASPRRPGDCCKFCKCKALCPENVALTMMPVVAAKIDTAPVTRLSQAQKQALAESVAAISPSGLAYIWRRNNIIRATLDAVKERLKNLPTDVLTTLHLEATDGRTSYFIPQTHTHKAIETIVDLGISEDDAWQLLKVDLTAAAKLFQANRGLTEAQAKEFVREKLADCLSKEVSDKIIREAKQ